MNIVTPLQIDRCQPSTPIHCRWTLGTALVNWHLVGWRGGVQVFSEGWVLVCVVGLRDWPGGVGLDGRVAVNVFCGEESHVGS